MNATSVDPLALALFLGGLSLLPLLILCCTCMLKVSIVLMIVRNGLGVQQVPPGMAVYAMALSLTAFVMAPTFTESMARFATPTEQAQPQQANALRDVRRVASAAEPFRAFMMKNTTPEGRARFLEIARRHWTPEMMAGTRDSDWAVLLPAFVVSQTQQAFEIGFILYLPFVVIDLVVSNLLLALGMQMVSPMTVSLPLKLLLFVQLDGWTRLLEALSTSYT